MREKVRLEVVGMTRTNSLRELVGDVILTEIHPTGSRYICEPAVLDTDEDYIIYVEEDDLKDVVNHLKDYGWEPCGEKLYETSVTVVVRKDELNLILINDYSQFKLWVLATETAKKLNLIKKPDRITLFKAFREGITYVSKPNVDKEAVLNRLENGVDEPQEDHEAGDLWVRDEPLEGVNMAPLPVEEEQVPVGLPEVFAHALRQGNDPVPEDAVHMNIDNQRLLRGGVVFNPNVPALNDVEREFARNGEEWMDVNGFWRRADGGLV